MDLAGPLVYGGDLDIPFYLFNLIFPYVAVTAKALYGIIGHGITCLCGEIFGYGALYLQVLLIRVKPAGDLLYICPGRLEPHRVGDKELMGVTLFLHKGGPELDPLLCIGYGLFKAGHPSTKTKGGDHQPCVPEDLVRLFQTQAFNAAYKVFLGDKKVLQGQWTGIGSPYPVFIFMSSRSKARRTCFSDEKRWTIRGLGKDGV